MSRPIYQVHYPKIGKITIKVDNIIMKYKHNDLVEEQAFFSKYPHIFKPRPDLKQLDFELAPVDEKVIEKAEEFIPVKAVLKEPIEPILEKPAEIPVPTPTPITKQQPVTVEERTELLQPNQPELFIQSPSKGWYIVVDANDVQIFPEAAKKCRKKVAEKFLEENKK